MAERIVSPGVFTRERDLSFLPQGISEIGAAIIGPTVKGPAFTPTIIRSFSEFEEVFGSTNKDYYTPYAVENYLRSAGTVTVVRVLGWDGYSVDLLQVEVTGGSDHGTVLAAFAPSRGSSGTGDLSLSTVTAGGTASSFVLNLSGSGITALSKTVSFTTSSADYVAEVFSSDPQVQKSGTDTVPVYLYSNFKFWQSGYSASISTAALTASVQTLNLTATQAYSTAKTPLIQSQAVSNARYDLFRVYTLSHGDEVNTKYKIAFLNIKAASAVAGSDYGTFSMQVREIDKITWKEADDVVLEQFDDLTFDPDSPNYFARRIGDQYVTISNDDNGDLTYAGDYPNMSKHIRVGDFTELEAYPKTVVPMGHKSVIDPHTGTLPTASFVRVQVLENDPDTFNSSRFYGFDFSNPDNQQYLKAVPSTETAGSNVSMSLENMLGHSASSASLGSTSTVSDGTEKVTLALSHVKQRKFVVPFQYGFNGLNPGVARHTGANIATTNTQGFNCSSATTGGTKSYKRAITAISNPDEFDINLLVTPGILHRLHPAVTNHGISKMEDRGDALYILDGFDIDDNISTATSAINALDTNYAATYYPWVKILDRNTNKPVWVPPSCVLPGVIAYTDQVAHEWFAPAGLNRGGLTTVVQAKKRLSHSDRDELYEDRINPIATFPGQGVVVWGQKTLQSKPSALDRVNVRRLLIRLKKFIASSSRYLVFEQNDSATRSRFLNIVNPFLESVQANSGLTAFRVVMDETNNTPDVIDRNRLVGQIFIQPTRTAEFIVLDFVVLPTGATFPE